MNEDGSECSRGGNVAGIEKLKSIWPQWRVLGEIGRGSYGTVYKAVREEHGVMSYSAIKVISIPQQAGEVKSLHADGLDDKAARNYFEEIVMNTVGEIKVLESMKGASNIVTIEDYVVLADREKIGWDIFIRMELLTSFLDYIADKKPDEAMVIKLGVDICSALEICAKRNIIHRDVKPENIFVSQFGDFKIGDFGIAKELERGGGSLSVSGTHNYMAPEVQSMRYNATVDIYSLGLVLYKLLNNNRLPFIDPNTQLINPQDYRAALDRRFSGEAIPNPVGASPELAVVIRNACEFDPDRRFQSATAFKTALSHVREWGSAARVEQMALPVQPVQAMQPARPIKTIQLARRNKTIQPVAPIQTVQPAMSIHVMQPIQAAQLVANAGLPLNRPMTGVHLPPSRSQLGPGYIKKTPLPERKERQKTVVKQKQTKGRADIIAIIALVVALAAVAIFALNGM